MIKVDKEWSSLWTKKYQALKLRVTVIAKYTDQDQSGARFYTSWKIATPFCKISKSTHQVLLPLNLCISVFNIEERSDYLHTMEDDNQAGIS